MATGVVTSATNSPLVPAAATTTTTSQQYISRRQRMEDEVGLSTRDGHGNVVLPPGVEPKTETETDTEKPKKSPPLPLGSTTFRVQLLSRNIRIGSLRSGPLEPVIVSTLGIQLCIQCCNKKLKLFVGAAELTKIMAHFGTVMPVLFIYTTPEGAAKIRNSCRMGAPGGAYFDPASADETQKRITVILKSVSSDQKDGLRHICHEIQLKHPSISQGLLLNEISQDQANSILVCSTPDVRQVVPSTLVTQLVPQVPQTLTQPVTQTASVVLSNGQLILQLPQGFSVVSTAARLGNGLVVGREDGEEGAEEDEEEEAMDRSRSPSPQHHIFSGPIIKLFTFPPAPATGGITVTNEDLFCLNEGEFLNDVIIDFYLKFIFIEHLSKEDQARTHIFSSFFYRRLTQKHRKNSMVDEDPNMSLPERRHARVKTWSRHVDLFDKDVIIVPINESAHWYLAIICFPGLRKPIHEERHVPPAVPKSPSPSLSTPSSVDIPKTPSKVSMMSVSSSSPSSTTVSLTSSSLSPMKSSSGMALLQASYLDEDHSRQDFTDTAP
ncbi:hypothetical protein NP493_494g02030 [Ridgeia piscesae]|uniref:Ubiquitin-like protease family profile domain-containing protein n=1 Tax=Ridgeia piscesae TaxID=27915 RepID=A0AAD9KXX1_RIDPI|nr:hypothetical protein NP493_494g02030 [Ridgeia piscesae]